MKRLLVTITLLLLVAAFLSACGTESTGDAKTTFCNSVTALNTAAQNVKSIGPNTSIDQAKQYGKDLEKAWSDTKAAAVNLKEAQINDIEGAYNEMIGAVNGITGNDTLAGAQAQIQAAALKFDASYAVINTTVCKV